MSRKVSDLVNLFENGKKDTGTPGATPKSKATGSHSDSASGTATPSVSKSHITPYSVSSSKTPNSPWMSPSLSSSGQSSSSPQTPQSEIPFSTAPDRDSPQFARKNLQVCFDKELPTDGSSSSQHPEIPSEAPLSLAKSLLDGEKVSFNLGNEQLQGANQSISPYLRNLAELAQSTTGTKLEKASALQSWLKGGVLKTAAIRKSLIETTGQQHQREQRAEYIKRALGDIHRSHWVDLELVTAALEHCPGPKLSYGALQKLAEVLRQSDNHRPLTAERNYGEKDLIANIVQEYREGSGHLQLSGHQLSKVQHQVEFLKTHQKELSEGVVNSILKLLDVVRDENDRRVVDRRQFRSVGKDYESKSAHSSTSDADPKLKWNDFQKANKGLGLSKAQLKENYREAKAAVESQLSQKLNSSQIPPSAASKSGPSNNQNASTASNSWNAFQAENSGKGWSKSQMSREYLNAKEQGASISSSTTSSSGSSSSTGSASSSSSSPMTNWNAFQRAHAGQGLSRAEMSAAYKQQQSSNSSSSSSYSSNSSSSYGSSSSSSYSSSSSSSNSWNAFQSSHAGMGYSRSQMSAAYAASKR